MKIIFWMETRWYWISDLQIGGIPGYPLRNAAEIGFLFPVLPFVHTCFVYQDTKCRVSTQMYGFYG